MGSAVLRPPSALSAWASQSTSCFAGTTWVHGPCFHLPTCKNVLVFQEPDLVLKDLLQFAHFFQNVKDDVCKTIKMQFCHVFTSDINCNLQNAEFVSKLPIH